MVFFSLDFSIVFILDMLRRNIRERPFMKWCVMGMTNMQVKQLNRICGLDSKLYCKLFSRINDDYIDLFALLL